MSLKLEFLESGVGETILITLPDGKKALVDAHPSSSAGLRVLNHLGSTEDLEFVCLTHPHADHGVGLIEVLRNRKVKEFWHTVTGVQGWMYAVDEIPTFPSVFQSVADTFMTGSGDFVRGIYGTVSQKKIPVRKLNSRVAPIVLGDVTFHVLGPEENDQNAFDAAYRGIALGKRKNIPSPNKLSAILAISYAGAVAILGGDALIKNWGLVRAQYHKLGLPSACLIKIPHHGASNAFHLAKPDRATYLGICAEGAPGILFAGDADHPDRRVEARLSAHLNLMCLANGRRWGDRNSPANPLGLNVPGARLAKPRMTPCQTVISLAIGPLGDLTINQGKNCNDCGLC